MCAQCLFPASGSQHARLVPGFPHRAPHGASGCGRGGRLRLALIDRARGQVTRGATFWEPGPPWLPRPGAGPNQEPRGTDLSGNKVVGPGAGGAGVARRQIGPAGSTAPGPGYPCWRREPLPRAAGRPSSAPPSLSNKGAGGGGEDWEEEPEPRAALEHKVVESPFPGGGERAAQGAGFLPPRAEEEPLAASAHRATSGSGTPSLSRRSCRRKTPACACRWTSVWTVLFLAELPGRKIAQVRGRFQSGVNFFSSLFWILSGFPRFI